MGNHPMMCFSIVLLTWGKWLISLMAWEPVGITVLPAYRAMVSAESIRFLIYILISVVMATHAYYGLPLQGFETTANLNMGWISFLRMYRLGILGDFDFWELEGVDPTLSAAINSTSGIIQGQIDEEPSDYSLTLHRDLRLLAIVLNFVLCVVIMNMYIGVLSHKYDSFKSNVGSLYGQAQCRRATRHLLHNAFWRTLRKSCNGTPAADESYSRSESLVADSETDDETFLLWGPSSCDEGALSRTLEMVPERRASMATVLSRISTCDERGTLTTQEKVDRIRTAFPTWETCSGLWIVMPDSLEQRTDDPVDDLKEELKEVQDHLRKDVADLKEDLKQVQDHLGEVKSMLKEIQGAKGTLSGRFG